MLERIACVLGIVTNTSAFFYLASLFIRCDYNAFWTRCECVLMNTIVPLNTILFFSSFKFYFIFSLLDCGKQTFEWHVFCTRIAGILQKFYLNEMNKKEN